MNSPASGDRDHRHRWRTGDRIPGVTMKHGAYILRIKVPATKNGKPTKFVTSADWKPGGWATELAALAARQQFKDWIDFDMHAAKRAAQSASVLPRTASLVASLARPEEPTRASGRSRPNVIRVAVHLNSVGGKVRLQLQLGQQLAGSSVDGDALLHWRKRSAGAQQRNAKRRRLEIESLGLAALGSEHLLEL
jgi:hypothetical protein